MGGCAWWKEWQGDSERQVKPGFSRNLSKAEHPAPARGEKRGSAAQKIWRGGRSDRFYFWPRADSSREPVLGFAQSQFAVLLVWGLGLGRRVEADAYRMTGVNRGRIAERGCVDAGLGCLFMGRARVFPGHMRACSSMVRAGDS